LLFLTVDDYIVTVSISCVEKLLKRVIRLRSMGKNFNALIRTRSCMPVYCDVGADIGWDTCLTNGNVYVTQRRNYEELEAIPGIY